MGKLKAKPANARIPAKPAQSIEKLARQQQVKPADDLDAIGVLWPADDEPEKFMNFILGERQNRRRLRGGK